VEEISYPRVLIAGLKGGSGKTLISLGLGRVLTELGLKVKGFKKGPDYIDAKWLGLAVGQEASNLDPFLFPKVKVKELFFSFAGKVDLALVEGNRGIFDGKDLQGSLSSAELARLLGLPVILVLDCTKITRTMAAIVQGIKAFEPDLDLKGVILNKTSGPRHRGILTQTIEHYTGLPVLGALPRLRKNPIPERHMGLVPAQEHVASLDQVFAQLAQVCRDNLNIEQVIQIARSSSKVLAPRSTDKNLTTSELKVTIGVVKDAAFWFYYQENLHALERAGAKLVFLSLLDDIPWPEIDGLYLGGGFPETMAEELETNMAKKALIKTLVEDGLPVYAECGGLMFLSQSICFQGREYEMSGIFPIKIGVQTKPKGHGYVEARVVQDNPFWPKGMQIEGHEFHYSYFITELKNFEFALDLSRGTGVHQGRDGLVYKNVFACYTHIHALGNPIWAKNFVLAAKRYKKFRVG